LGSYRFFYLLNWVVRLFGEHYFDFTSVIFGMIQTALYVDFAWVYWSRQRVKLRYGGVVDSDDLSKSFIVKRFIGRRGNVNSTDGEDDITEEEDRLAAQESGTVRPSANRGQSDRWGARGISVSADDTLQEHLDHSSRDAQMVDPSHFEDDDEDDADAPPPPAKDAPSTGLTASSDSTAASPEAEHVVGSSATEWSK
jgi:hypothetical protein